MDAEALPASIAWDASALPGSGRPFSSADRGYCFAPTTLGAGRSTGRMCEKKVSAFFS